MKKSTYLILIFFIALTSCNDKELEFLTDYESYLEELDEIKFDSNSEADTLLAYPTTKTNGTDFIVYDPLEKRFKKFDENYDYKSTFGNTGRGPSEYLSFTQYGFSRSDNNFYVYDSRQSKLIAYAEDEEESFEFNIRERLIDLDVSRNGNILIYHLSSAKESVLALYNKKGELLKEFFTPADQNLKTFLYMFRHGDIHYNESKNRFYFLYPDSFDIFEISTNGNITDTLKFSQDSGFHRKPSPMPQGLDPFESSEAHWEYLASDFRPTLFYLVGDDKILFQSVSFEDSENYEFYYSLFHINGDPVFEGLIFPEELNHSITDQYQGDTFLMYMDGVLKKIRFKN